MTRRRTTPELTAAEMARLRRAHRRRAGDLSRGLFTPASVTWRVHREAAVLLGGGRALLLQVAHPLVAAGVAAHSRFRSAPLERLRRTLDLMLTLVFVMSTFCLNFNVLLPVLAKQTLHSGPQVFGLLSGIFGVGALIGALVSAHVSRATVGTTAIGSAGFALCELLIAPLRTTSVIALLLFLGGVCFTTWSSNSNSLIQLASPDHLRGRLIGIYFFAFAGTGTLGGILSGWLTAAGGTELSFAVAGIAGVSMSLYVWLRSRAVPLVEEGVTA